MLTPESSSLPAGGFLDQGAVCPADSSLIKSLGAVVSDTGCAFMPESSNT